MRGEYAIPVFSSTTTVGSPPLARGIQLGLADVKSDNGITPACAGNTNGYIHYIHLPKDHPRLRGEYKATLTISTDEQGSPPLARGIRTV